MNAAPDSGLKTATRPVVHARRIIGLCCAAVTSLVAPAITFAQEAGVGDNTIEEIVVTATRRDNG